MSITNVKDNINISSIVIDHLKNKSVFSGEGNEISFITGTDKRTSITKLIIVNTLYAMEDNDTDEIYGTLNVNIQDTDTIWIEYIGELIQLFLDESVIGNYKLEYTTEHLFKVSKDLFFKNLKFKFCTI